MAVISKLTSNGNLAISGSFDEYTMGASNYGVQFNGSSQYLSLASNAALQPGSGSFTIEAWIYPLNTSQGCISFFGGTTSYWGVRFERNAGGGLQVLLTNDAVSWQVNYTAGTIINNVWSHVALVKNGTSILLFINGIQVGLTQSISGSVYTGGSFNQIGICYNTNYFNGYISNFRFIKGTAIYTAAFTPPTSPLTNINNTSLLTCQSSTIIDNSSNAFAITNNGTATILSNALTFKTIKKQYSDGTFQTLGYIDEYTLAATKNYVAFNGTSQYLTTATSTALGFGTGDFTIEAWVYTTNLTATNTINDARTGNTASAYVFAVFSSGALNFYDGPNNTDRTTSTGLISLNTWYHVAATRSGTTLRLFVNGVLASTFTGISSDYGSTQPSLIGRQQSGSGYFYGHISNVRIIKGTAIYTAAFTPPVGPLLPITNTSLLTCQSPTIIDNSTNNFAITNNGSAVVAPNLNLYTINYSGASQYLRMPYSAAFDFSAATWTAECWFKAKAFDLVILSKDTYGTNFDFCIYVSATTIFSQTAGTAQSYNVTTGLTLTPGVWYHLAMVRNAGTLNYYLNGVKYGAGSTMGITNASQSYVTMGCFSWNNPSGYMNGSISNFRMVQGTALYTSNFTPVQANLTAISGTTFLTAQSATIIDNSTNAIVITNTNGVTTSAPLFSQTLADTQSSDGIYRIAGEFDEVTGINLVPLEYLASAGGGSGGGYGSPWDTGGGGAGGLLFGTFTSAATVTYTVTVGAGATGGAGNNTNGSQGSDTTIIGSGVSVRCYGGGGGALWSPAGSGGSGGGVSQQAGYGVPGKGVYPGSTYVDAPRQGYDGAPGGGIIGSTGGYGGGGGGSAGSPANGDRNGGPGTTSSFSGTSVTYALGGYGGNGATAGVNTGTGGGGGANGGTVGGGGGSGIVIIRYPNTYIDATATTGSPTYTNTGGYKIYKFTSSGSITF